MIVTTSFIYEKVYTTSNHAHEVLGSASGGIEETMRTTTTTATREPKKTPRMVREGRRPAAFSSPHSEGMKYCVNRMVLRSVA